MLLDTGDLTLHQGFAEDGPELYRSLWSRPEVFRCLFQEPCATEQEGMERTAAWIHRQRQEETAFFIYRKNTGQAMGLAAIRKTQPGEWEVTDLVIGPDFQNRGYGEQALRALIHLVLVRCGGRRLTASCFSDNFAAKELLLRCGFHFCRSREAPERKGGQPVRLEHYALDGPAKETKLCVRAVVRRGGRVLLVKRQRGPWAGLWDLPGGCPEPGEDQMEALRRLLREECGLEPASARLVRVDSVREPYYDEQRQLEQPVLVQMFYEAQVEGPGAGVPGAAWFTPERMETMALTHHARRMLQTPEYTIVPYEADFRDQMVFLVLEAENALGREPRLDRDLLDVGAHDLDGDCRFWLAVNEDQQVLGCIGCRLRQGSGEAVLCRLYVKTALQCRGIGTALLKTAEEALRDQDVRTILACLSDGEYPEACRFCLKHGYKPCGEAQMCKKLRKRRNSGFFDA